MNVLNRARMVLAFHQEAMEPGESDNYGYNSMRVVFTARILVGKEGGPNSDCPSQEKNCDRKKYRFF